MTKLNAKQRLFVKHYIATLNGAESARRAGYSANSAKETASRLLTNDNIQHAIEEGAKERLEKAGVQAEDVIAEIAKLAMMNGEELEEWADKFGMRVADKTKALELLGRYHTLFTDRVEQSSEVQINVTIDGLEDEE